MKNMSAEYSRYAVGFNIPETGQLLFISQIIMTTAQESSAEKLVFSEYGRGFTSKTQAKRFRYNFQNMFEEDDLIREKAGADQPINLTLQDIKSNLRIFDRLNLPATSHASRINDNNGCNPASPA